MKDRLVIPEILDSLPHTDPAAKRARRDLRVINWLMGNYRWVSRRVLSSSCRNWFELGAGEGRLSSCSSPAGKGVVVTGVDFAPRPHDWPDSWHWMQGDLFDSLDKEAKSSSSGCIAVLFLHHFQKPELQRLGGIVEEKFAGLVVAEPARYRIFRVLAYALFPFVNSVTWHDMQISIGAGFKPGELMDLLGLGSNWQASESVHWLGGYRIEAWKENS
ncbi:MAG: hypothetical protein P1U81_01090 [Verrucomicrobiales bacterium]|nr:hypothetical protein [Verrucomicrobiales bacterium]